ncbi:MAG TPA: endonuclease/exonuclease/phosphatase family protein [Devosiaceae bacterium]|jgi:endonuclease/exonuclease/phosphatase (EEP) superfamily protein YafD
MTLLLRLVRFAFGSGALGISLLAILALLGFAVPALDVLNHLQVVLFAGTLVSLVAIAPLMGRGNWRRFVLAATATGLLASAVTVVPEAIAAFAPRPPVPTDGRTVVKMMTHNLFGMNYDMQRVADVVFAEDPDILALQEYFGQQSSALGPLLHARYPYSAYCHGGKRANIALYSKIPFTQTQDNACPENAYGHQRTAHILAKFTLADGTTFSVLTTHLDWPAPKIMRQEEQFASLRDTILNTPGPLVVAGDFNSTSWSYTQRNFAREAKLRRETHAVMTFPMRFWILGWRDTWPPFLPLDQVMTRDLTVHDLHSGPRTGSDHLPIIFTFSVPKT